jgi:hypothetical protein
MMMCIVIYSLIKYLIWLRGGQQCIKLGATFYRHYAVPLPPLCVTFMTDHVSLPATEHYLAYVSRKRCIGISWNEAQFFTSKTVNKAGWERTITISSAGGSDGWETSEKSFNCSSTHYFRLPPSENENKTSIYETWRSEEKILWNRQTLCSSFPKAKAVWQQLGVALVIHNHAFFINVSPLRRFSFSKVNHPMCSSPRSKLALASARPFSKPCNMHRAFPSTCLILAWRQLALGCESVKTAALCNLATINSYWSSFPRSPFECTARNPNIRSVWYL